MKLVSVNAARVGNLFVQQSGHSHRIVSGIRKQPQQGAVHVGRLGLDSDEQADLSVHGGLDKAVYAYPFEHYAFWSKQRLVALKRDEALEPGAMGENLTLLGVLECDVWVGDRLRIGTVLLEVTEPRQPCFKFNVRMGFSHASKMMMQAGNSGFYLRVIETGELAAGDAVILHPGRREMAIAQINERRRKGSQQDLF